MKLLAKCLGALIVGLSGLVQAGTVIAIAGDRDGLAMTSVVIALKPVGVAAPVTVPATITVTQEAMTFKPYIAIIRKGSSVVFANRDTVEHHI